MLPFGVLSMLGGVIIVRSLIFGSSIGFLGGLAGNRLYIKIFDR